MDEKTKAHNALITTAFKGNDPLLQLMRALFLDLEITSEDKEMIRTSFANPELRAAIRHRFLPVLSRESPVGVVYDMWMGTEKQVFGQPPNVIRQAIEYKSRCIAFMEKALALLENPDGDRPDLSYNPDSVRPTAPDYDELQVLLLGRNQFIQLVETQLQAFKTVANAPEEKSPDQIKKATKKNSGE